MPKYAVLSAAKPEVKLLGCEVHIMSGPYEQQLFHTDGDPTTKHARSYGTVLWAATRHCGPIFDKDPSLEDESEALADPRSDSAPLMGWLGNVSHGGRAHTLADGTRVAVFLVYGTSPTVRDDINAFSVAKGDKQATPEENKFVQKCLVNADFRDETGKWILLNECSRSILWCGRASNKHDPKSQKRYVYQLTFPNVVEEYLEHHVPRGREKLDAFRESQLKACFTASTPPAKQFASHSGWTVRDYTIEAP